MMRNVMRLSLQTVGGSEKSRFYLADVQNDALSPSCMHVTAFYIDQQLHQWHFVMYFPMFNEALLQAAGVRSFLLQLFKKK